MSYLRAADTRPELGMEVRKPIAEVRAVSSRTSCSTATKPRTDRGSGALLPGEEHAPFWDQEEVDHGANSCAVGVGEIIDRFTDFVGRHELVLPGERFLVVLSGDGALEEAPPYARAWVILRLSDGAEHLRLDAPVI